MTIEYRNLGDIATNLDNLRIPLNAQEREAKTKLQLYPYFGANNILCYIDEYIFDEEILCIAEDGGSWGSNQKCAFVFNGKCWVNNHAHVLRSNGQSNLHYLKAYLNYANLNAFINGTTRGKLTRKALDSIQIPLPPLPEQIAIANILSKAEALIAKRKESLALLDAYLKSTFLEMFGDPVRNEKGWEVKKLGDLIDIQEGLVNPNEAPYSEMYHVGGANIESDTGHLKNLEYAKNENLISGKYLFSQDHLLYSKIRPYLNKVATPKFIGICSADIYPIKPKDNLISKQFLRFVLTSKSFLLHAENNSDRANIPKINRKALVQYEFCLPPLELQNQFAAVVEKVEALKEKYQKSLGELENLYGSLSQRAFRGELGVGG